MAFKVVDEFEKRVADFAGAEYGVAVMNATCGLFLACKYREIEGQTVSVPARTYPGVAMSIVNAGGWVDFNNKKWKGIYELFPIEIYDSALRFRRGMYIENSLYVLSFALKKLLPIGRGGMILTDNKDAYEWLKKARFDGRTEGVPLNKDNYNMIGWNMYMAPPEAARGLWLFDMIKDKRLKDIDPDTQGYPDLSKFPIFK